MFDKLGKKLLGDEEERAVSPVIGVIMMVAITVILAAVIAAFVLDMGDSMGSGSVEGAVSSDVSNNDASVTFQLDNQGSAEEFVVRGTKDDDLVDESEVKLNEFNGVRTTHTLDYDGNDENDKELEESGSLSIVAIDGDAESTVGSVEWDFEE
jgi:archaeal type IV pilus assembly protein PilA